MRAGIAGEVDGQAVLLLWAFREARLDADAVGAAQVFPQRPCAGCRSASRAIARSDQPVHLVVLETRP